WDGSVVDDLEPMRRDQLGEYHLHFEHREVHAEAAPGTSAERQVLVWRVLLLEEALGPELGRTSVDVIAAMDRVERDAHHRAGHDVVWSQPERLLHESATAIGDERVVAQRLAHDSVEIRQLVHGGLAARDGRGQLLAQAGEHR